MHFLMYLLAVALQAPDSGAFVITLGEDTIGMERYTRTADRLVDDMVMRDRAPVISRHFVATLGADGLISHIELDNKPVVASAVSPTHAVGRYTKDEALVDLTRNSQTTTAHVATPDGRGALPFINFCYALYDQTGLRARALGGSPVKVAVLGFGGTNTFDLTVTFPARDSMGVAFEGDAPPSSRSMPRGPSSERTAGSRRRRWWSPACRRSTSMPSPRHSGTDPSANSRLLTRCGSMSPAPTSPSTTAAPPCAAARSSATSSHGIRCGAPAGTSPHASRRPPTS